MKNFLDNDFLLTTDTAKELYHDHAAKMPIIDYHCHLIPQQIAENYQFKNMTEIWLGGDHYKWRAMRANGVSEDYITGDKPDFEKFEKWADTLQHAMRNPLYHWTHLELSRIFGVNEVLNPSTAREIYDKCNEMLKTDEFRPHGIMKRMKVDTVCTTDDPIDSLEYHKQIANSALRTHVYPTWRPDKAMAIENISLFNDYINKLEKASNISISSFNELIAALQNRHDFFKKMGCRLSDHGITEFEYEDYTNTEVAEAFDKARQGKAVSKADAIKFQSALLYELAAMDARAGWVQQFHIGATRNNNALMFRKLGADTGYDAVADARMVVPIARFLSRLTEDGLLAKSVFYNLNSKDNEALMTTIYSFNDGTEPGKMQYGAGWWFLDQIHGIRHQLDTLSDLGLLSRFVGMLTDSRSFLSYPRHEYFRRILCETLGNEIENGELPASELPFIGQMVEDISYNNAKNYFKF
jgi:glucuronate isomerase